MSETISTINTTDQANFDRLAGTWWDAEGPHQLLHRMNPLRLAYILKQGGTLEDKSVLDVGCGGGLLTEPLARLGATVTGLDTAPNNITVARTHAKDMGLKITYDTQAIEDFALTHPTKFDLICASEVVEHVENLPLFLKSISACLKPNGHLFLSTLNRTFTSYALGIFMAETILKWVPKGTHDWSKFLKPADLVLPLDAQNIKTHHIQGITYSPFKKEWLTTDSLRMNYFLWATKNC